VVMKKRSSLLQIYDQRKILRCSHR